ncbi:hypothetical protein BB561_006448 [Smittium simulii]|uniref:HMG box domain-containing protein n=1 Tax=Smittium simulii TaxID=133385 RepID=A0A2T9Y437_9FUNG|nr:hypothetical protein BB561_006448 [Smittium simulii]
MRIKNKEGIIHKVRAIGAKTSARTGISIDAIIAQANWFRYYMFSSYCRLPNDSYSNITESPKSTISAAIRYYPMGQHSFIAYTTVLCRNSGRLTTCGYENSIFTAISIKCFSSKSKDTNLLDDDKFNQIIPKNVSIKSLKTSKYIYGVPTVKESNKDNFQINKSNENKEFLKKKELLLCSLKKSKLLEIQKLRASKQAQDRKLKEAKLLKDQKLKKAKLIKDQKIKKTKLLIAQKFKETELLLVQKIKKDKLLEAKKLKIIKLLELAKDQKLKEAKLLRSQKIKASNLAKAQTLKIKLAQKKRIITQKKKVSLEKLKSHKKLIARTRLVVPTLINSAYGLFNQDEYKKLKDNTSSTIDQKNIVKNNLKILANWRLKTEAEKLEYEQKYKLLKEQFNIELYKWWDNVDKNLVQLENRRRKNINKTRKDKGIRSLSILEDPRAPKFPASVYAMFVKDLKESNHPELPTKWIDFVKYAGAKWKQLPEIEKNTYRDKYKDAFKLYKEVSDNCK